MSKSTDCPECPVLEAAHRLARRLCITLGTLDHVSQLLPPPMKEELVEALGDFGADTPAAELECEIMGECAQTLAGEHPDIIRCVETRFDADGEEVGDE